MNFISYNSPFGRFMNRLVDVLFLSLLTLLCSLPIVTVGASFSALYYVLFRMARGTDEGVMRDFFKGFRQNFFKGTALWLIILSFCRVWRWIMGILYVYCCSLWARS